MVDQRLDFSPVSAKAPNCFKVRRGNDGHDHG